MQEPLITITINELNVDNTLDITNGNLKLSYGITADRPISSDLNGSVRYNTSLNVLEIFSPNLQDWTTIGGVMDIDGETKILSESTLGANDNVLKFYTGGSERMKIDSNGNVSIENDLIINGNTVSINSTITTIDDPVITLGKGDLSINDNKDRGISFNWHNGSESKIGFMGYDQNNGLFRFIKDCNNSSAVDSSFNGSNGALSINKIYFGDNNDVITNEFITNSGVGSTGLYLHGTNIFLEGPLSSKNNVTFNGTTNGNNSNGKLEWNYDSNKLLIDGINGTNSFEITSGDALFHNNITTDSLNSTSIDATNITSSGNISANNLSVSDSFTSTSLDALEIGKNNPGNGKFKYLDVTTSEIVIGSGQKKPLLNLHYLDGIDTSGSRLPNSIGNPYISIGGAGYMETDGVAVPQFATIGFGYKLEHGIHPVEIGYQEINSNNSTNGNIIFATRDLVGVTEDVSTIKMTIQYDGNVGIGTTTPTE